MRKIAMLVVVALSLSVFTGIAAARGGGGKHRQQDVNLVELLASQEKYSTLVSLVQKAGLVEALAGEDMLTVFAPSNKAFERLAMRNPDLFNAVLADADLLKAVLLYHVAPGKIDAATIVGLSSVGTLLGPDIAVSLKRGFVRLNAEAENAKVVRVDMMATNGIAHSITEVLIPPING